VRIGRPRSWWRPAASLLLALTLVGCGSQNEPGSFGHDKGSKSRGDPGLGAPVQSEISGLVVPSNAAADHTFDYNDAGWTERQYRLPNGVDVPDINDWYGRQLSQPPWSPCSVNGHPGFVREEGSSWLTVELFTGDLPEDQGATFVEVSSRAINPC
jgi:hypothetical protein